MPLLVNTIVFDASHVIAAGDSAVITSTGGMMNGVVSLGGSASLFNDGFINRVAPAVIVAGAGIYIENHGSLTGGGTLGTIDAYSSIASGLTSLELINYGSITTRGLNDTAAIVTRSAGNSITNFGNITARFDAAIEILDESTVLGLNRVINHGYIKGGDGDFAISIDNAGPDRITNTGTIVGGALIIGGNDVVRNSGEINGTLNFAGSGDDQVFNSGVITGQLILGPSNDLADLRGGQILNDVIDNGGNDSYFISDPTIRIRDFGGDADEVTASCDYAMGEGLETLTLRGTTAIHGIGNDLANTINGTARGNVLEGADGDDMLSGFGGNDTVLGGAGVDALLGGNGNDTLDGGDGNDTLRGEAGDDILNGGDNNDNLIGATGNDIFYGGLGRDNLSDAGGADVFVYRSVLDSGTTAATRDKISGFVSGEDVIDLAAIDANVNNAADSAFTLVGAFTGVAGQLVFGIVGSDGILSGDINGDSTADFSIQLNGVAAILATDLVL